MENTLIFKKVSGEIISDPEQYVKKWVKDNPYGKVIIGCDSQIHGRRIKYSIAIVMHNIDKMGVGHGAHVIVSDIWEKRKTRTPIDEMPTKLWAEAEYTLIAAQMIDGNDETFKKRMMLHLDFSDNAKDKSNMMFAAGIGYLSGMGYRTEGKPFSYVASHTADHFCK
jgi:predicted RNase H-related nuclease YkuK (DUF458 family)